VSFDPTILCPNKTKFIWSAIRLIVDGGVFIAIKSGLCSRLIRIRLIEDGA